MCFEIRPQVEHEISKQRHNETILLLALVHDVECFGEILCENIERLQAVRDIVVGIAQISCAIQLIDTVQVRIDVTR